MTTRQLPLDGLKVVELGQLIAGPFATKLLGEFVADVIKIEPPGTGDPLRKWRILEEGTSLWWHVQSRTKRSVTLDLRSEEGQEMVRRLAAEARLLHREWQGCPAASRLRGEESRELQRAVEVCRMHERAIAVPAAAKQG